MKKRTIIIAAICLALGLCICLGVAIILFTGDDSVTEDEWKAMLDASNFENYTLTQSVTDNSQAVASREDFIIRFTKDKISISKKLNGGDFKNEIVKDEAIAAQKKSYENIFLALLADYNNFTYDSGDEVYTNVNQITATIDLSTQGQSGSIAVVMENGKVALDEDGRLVDFSCKLTKTTTQQLPGLEEPYVVTTTEEITWHFSDYGTTVVSE